jgi:hypothetical protein
MRFMTPTGQFRAQAEQSTSSVLRMQRVRSTTARPICIALFSATVIGRIAPVGQTIEHFTQLTRQYPRSNEREGCKAPAALSEEIKARLGQFATQSWQPVHLDE